MSLDQFIYELRQIKAQYGGRIEVRVQVQFGNAEAQVDYVSTGRPPDLQPHVEIGP